MLFHHPLVSFTITPSHCTHNSWFRFCRLPHPFPPLTGKHLRYTHARHCNSSPSTLPQNLNRRFYVFIQDNKGFEIPRWMLRQNIIIKKKKYSRMIMCYKITAFLYHKKSTTIFIFYTTHRFVLYSNMIAEINSIFVLPAAYLNKITQRLQRRGPREQWMKVKAPQ